MCDRFFEAPHIDTGNNGTHPLLLSREYSPGNVRSVYATTIKAGMCYNGKPGDFPGGSTGSLFRAYSDDDV